MKQITLNAITCYLRKSMLASIFYSALLLGSTLNLLGQNISENIIKKPVPPKRNSINNSLKKEASITSAKQKISLSTASAASVASLVAATYNFTPSTLIGTLLGNPTSLQFGPDSRLYVAEQGGVIKVYSIIRDSANHYTVTATEQINLINTIPNHNDDGSLNTSINYRQVTGILLRGTANNPIIYVTSSDRRVGGPNGSLNLDTNSGIISMLTWNGSQWVKLDLVRGLPRSEENHSSNGIQLDDKTNILYIAQGGNTNAGAPSHNFDYTCEYALSAAILSIDLNVIKALPVMGIGNMAYLYDLPTLDDPSRANNSDGSDVNDPFGGNNGLNQAKIITGGPVQVYSPGYRNPYDLIITQERNMYTIDNGANPGWGGYPKNEGTDTVNNNYVIGEPGSTAPSASQSIVNNLDNLHFIGNLDTYVPGSFYGGHPNPIRANPSGAGLYTVAANDSFFRTSTTGSHPLPVDWPPVPKANPIEGRFKMPGVADGALLTFQSSTNGIAQYNASNFNGALKGALLACGMKDKIFKINLTADGTNVTNSKGVSSLNLDAPFAANFASNPLDITIQNDSTLFAGTIWVANYTSKSITIFEPSDFNICTGAYDSGDDDKDHYTNMDELDNGTDPCSASSIPPDNDHDFISDLNDPDDDNDGISDTTDVFAIDANNGLSTALPISYDFLNNDPGTGFFGVGFTGLMTNNKSDYLTLFDKSNLIVGGAVGAFTILNVTSGDALGALNNQENAFQFGVKASNTQPFTVVSSLLGPFFNNQTPQNNQSQGIYIGNGDQDNYFKIALNANGGAGGIEVVYENAGVPVSTQYSLTGGNLNSSTIVLYLMADPLKGTIQPQYAINKGQVINIGAPIVIGGALLSAIKNVYAIGIIATSRGGLPFTASWDYFYIANTPVANAGPDIVTTNNSVVLNGSGTDVASKIKAYQWNQVSGPFTATFSPNKLITNPTITGLLPGKYIFALTVVDSLNAVSIPDSVTITVNAFLIANAGTDTLITLPANSAILHGSGLNIYPVTLYKWSQFSGPNTALFSPDNFNKDQAVSGLTQGSYIFNLVITDSFGSVSKPDTVIVSVAANGGITTQTWQTLTPSSGAIIGREEHGYVQAGNKFYLMGGRGIVPVQEYDPALKSWVNKSNPPVELNHFQPVTYNGLTYILGAMNGGYPHEVPLPNVYIYNAASDKWLTGSTIPVSRRRGAAATVSYNNKIYLICGITDGHWAGWVNWFDEYDPATNTWKVLPDAPRVRDHVQAQVINNMLYVAGGRRTSASTGEVFSLTVPEVDVFDFTSGTWSTLPAGSNLPIPRAGAANIAVGNQLIVIGGESGLQVPANSETHALDITTNTWTRLADLQTGRHGAGAIFSGNGIYTASGPSSRGGSPLLTNQELYYTATPNTNYGNAIVQDQLTTAVNNINFSGTPLNSTVKKVIAITNTGTGQDILVTSITKKNGAGTFTYTTPFPLPFTITAGSTVNITVNFSPQSAVLQKDTLIIAHSAQNGSLAITLSGQGINVTQTANAGADKFVILPANSAVLNGTGIGTYPIVSYNWKQISGPNTAIFSPNNTTANTTVSGLIPGAYLFTLNVTDSAGTISQPDTVIVSVAAAPIITQTWQTLTPSSGAIIGREEHGYVQAGNKFYLMGGRGIVPVQEYDPALKSWVNKSNPPVELNHFQPVTYNGLTYILGAMNGGYPHEVPLPNVYIYNAASDKWLTGSTIPVSRRRGAAATVSYNNKIYLICGITDGHWAGWVNWFDEYDPATNTWKVLTNAPRVRDHVQAQIINSKLYLAGGRRTSASTGDVFGLTVPEVDVYDFVSGTWSTLPAGSNLPIPRAGAANIAAGNQLIVVGGESGLQTLAHNETHALDVTTNTWQRLPNLQTGRHGAGAIFSGNGIYTASGPSSRGGIPLLTTQELYYTATPNTNYGNAIVQDQLTTPANLTFSGVAVNTSGSKTIALTNTGTGQDILITSIAISGSASFTYNSPYPLPFTIAAGKTINLTVVYLPTSTASQSASIIVAHSGQNINNTVSLTGMVGSIPIADAGPNKAVTIPVNSLVLNGAGSGTNPISTYSWKELSGPNTAVFLPNLTAQTPTIGSLILGTYIFTLTITDNQLLVSKPDTVIVTVNSANSGTTYTLINAVTNQDISLLKEGSVLNLATLPTNKLNIRANSTPSVVGSFIFDLSGTVVRRQVEGAAPYALFGDNGGVFYSWIPPVGYYTLKGTPYSAASGTGTAGIAFTLNFSVINKVGLPAISSNSTIEILPKSLISNYTKSISAYPNPSNDGLFTVVLPYDLTGNVTYTLVSGSGKKLAHSKILFGKPASTLHLDFSKEMLSPGLYYLNIECKNIKTQCILSKIK